MGGASAGAAPIMTAVLPPGADAASMMLAAAASARGAAAVAMLSELTATRAAFGATVGANGLAYSAADAANQAILAL